MAYTNGGLEFPRAAPPPPPRRKNSRFAETGERGNKARKRFHSPDHGQSRAPEPPGRDRWVPPPRGRPPPPRQQPPPPKEVALFSKNRARAPSGNSSALIPPLERAESSPGRRDGPGDRGRSSVIQDRGRTSEEEGEYTEYQPDRQPDRQPRRQYDDRYDSSQPIKREPGEANPPPVKSERSRRDYEKEEILRNKLKTLSNKLSRIQQRGQPLQPVERPNELRPIVNMSHPKSDHERQALKLRSTVKTESLQDRDASPDDRSPRRSGDRDRHSIDRDRRSAPGPPPAPGGQPKNEKFKSRLCVLWARGKICPFGDRCNFAHGEHELQHNGGRDTGGAKKRMNDDRGGRSGGRGPPPKRLKKGGMPGGGPGKKANICKHFLKNQCLWGTSCSFSHDLSTMANDRGSQRDTRNTDGPRGGINLQRLLGLKPGGSTALATRGMGGSDKDTMIEMLQLKIEALKSENQGLKSECKLLNLKLRVCSCGASDL